MSYRPGTRIISQDSPPPRSSPTDTGVWLIAGITEKGPLQPVQDQPIESMSDFARIYGSRISTGIAYDAAEVFFHEGGGSLYVARVVGPAAATAPKNFNDAGAATALAISANAPGAWGNNLRVAILAGDVGGNFKIQVTHATDPTVNELSPDLADPAAAVSWAQYSSYITAALGASSNDPVTIAAQALTGGNDDAAAVTDTQWQQALDRLSKELGPGQVSAPGRTTDVGHQQLVAHARDYNRVALLDPPDTNTSATLIASAAAARSDGRYAAMFWPWVKVPGTTSGTVRTVPPSASVAGIIANSDGTGHSPNQPAAGDNGESRYAVGLSRPATGETAKTPQERDALNTASVNVIRPMFGGFRVYGWRSLADPVAMRSWINFGNSRLHMAIVAEANNILETYLFEEIDGRGILMNDLKGSLNGMLLTWYNLGSLYGETPDQAFYVDVGPQVNTPTTIANRELHAVITLRMSEFAEYIELVLVKRAITEGVI